MSVPSDDTVLLVIQMKRRRLCQYCAEYLPSPPLPSPSSHCPLPPPCRSLLLLLFERLAQIRPPLLLVLTKLVLEPLARRGKFAQLVAHHLLGDGNGEVLLAVVDQEAQPM